MRKFLCEQFGYLRLNGLAFAEDALELAIQIEAITTRKGNLEEAIDGFEGWLRRQVRPREES